MPKRNIIWILVAGVVALLLWKVPEGWIRRDALYSRFSALLDVDVQVRKHYVDEVKDDDMLRGAIEGMLGRLDPYCVYFTPDEFKQFNRQTEGQFYGIGIEVSRLPDIGLIVVSPIEGSPAFHAGLRAGDRITAIDGAKTDDMPLEKSVEMISGKNPGTSVTLTLYRPATQEILEKTITRGLVTIPTIRGWARSADWKWDYLIDPDEAIGYIRISKFEKNTEQYFDAEMRKLLTQPGIRGLVVDLRDNPGGLLDVVVAVANHFITKGRIVSTRRRNGTEQVFLATDDGKYPDLPMAVLINGGSASASEILAGCLRDHGRAVLVGEKSFGKGSVQELIELENGHGAVKLTTAYYYLPDGERIHGHGVMPNRIVDLTQAELVELLASQMAVYSASGSPTTTQAATSTAPSEGTGRVEIKIDRQLAEALDVVRGQLATRPAQ